MDQHIARIVTPTDFSPAADRAMWRAASLASTLHSALYLLHVLPPREVLNELFPGPATSEGEALHARAERVLQERAQTIAQRFDVTPERKLLHGEAHAAILDVSDSVGANLLVFGAQGEREGMSPPQTVGDTALKVAERSRVATLLVRREAQDPYRHVVACVKVVPADRAVIEWANRVSPADLIHLVSAYTVPYERRLIEWGASRSTLESYARREQDLRTRRLSDLEREFGLPAARARLHVQRGEAVPTVLGHAELWRADLLLVGRRAEADSLSAGIVGSVARQIALLAPMDVMIVPPPAPS
jgi:nucleotide-binding universal stress UspA family protein